MVVPQNIIQRAELHHAAPVLRAATHVQLQMVIVHNATQGITKTVTHVLPVLLNTIKQVTMQQHHVLLVPAAVTHVQLQMVIVHNVMQDTI